MNSTPWYFEFAGCVIRFMLEPTEFTYLVDEMERMLLDQYGGFRLKREPMAFDYSVKVTYQLMTEYIVRKNSYFVKVYGRHNKKTLHVQYGISSLQLNQLIRTLIQEYLENNNGLIVHASSVLMQDEAVMFTGNPRAGKSTIMKLLAEKFSPLSDDSVIIRGGEGSFMLYQAPVQEKENWITKNGNKHTLGAVFFLKKSKRFAIRRIDAGDAIQKRLFSQFWLQSSQSTIKQLKTFTEFANSFNRFYEISFAKDSRGLLACIQEWIEERNT